MSDHKLDEAGTRTNKTNKHATDETNKKRNQVNIHNKRAKPRAKEERKERNGSKEKRKERKRKTARVQTKPVVDGSGDGRQEGSNWEAKNIRGRQGRERPRG